MKKRASLPSKFSVSHVPKLNPYLLKKVNTQDSKIPKIQNQINPAIAKWSFIFLMILIFFALLYRNPSIKSLTSYSVVDINGIYSGLNFIIFFALLALIFFLNYEKRKQNKKSK